MNEDIMIDDLVIRDFLYGFVMKKYLNLLES